MIFCRVLFLVWMVLGLGITLAKHGEPKREKYNFGLSFIAGALQLLLLWGGGFFS